MLSAQDMEPYQIPGRTIDMGLRRKMGELITHLFILSLCEEKDLYVTDF